jgi:hypothetical protein
MSRDFEADGQWAVLQEDTKVDTKA